MSIKRPTIKDVANECKLSVASVSLVLNNKPNRLSITSRKLIFETAEALGYRPNQVAVSMVTKKTFTLGLIIPDISNTFFAEISRAIEDAASRYGYTIIYGNTNDKINGDIQYITNFIDRGVDGIILAPAAEPSVDNYAGLINIIQTSPVPIILIDRSLPNANVKSIAIDHHYGAYIATKHLLSLGHRQIGCLTGPLHLSSTKDKLEGYQKALNEYNITFNPNLIYEGHFRFTKDPNVLPYFINQGATAVFTHNDLMALNLYSQKNEFNIQIPEDLSVIGFDNIFLGDFLDVPLTSIAQPINKIAEIAVKEILQSIEGENTSEKITFLPSLQVKGSTSNVGILL